MHTAFLPPENWTGVSVELDPDESIHLVKSVRAREGDKLRLFDGSGKAALARIDRVLTRGKTASVICIVEKMLPVCGPSTRLTLIQALPKGSRMDFLVEKATELGVWEVLPVITERVEKQPGGKGYEGQVERWRRISLSAAKQCGSAWLPAIRPVAKLETALDTRTAQAAPFVVGVLSKGAKSLGDFLQTVGNDTGSAAVLIGPEGDLTDAEIDLAVKAGACPVSFGNLVMRVETAAIYAVSVMKYHFKWDAWEER